ncbi:hypothetical protein ACHQM5_004731 [Ranunculus cassubicifolius]
MDDKRLDFDAPLLSVRRYQAGVGSNAEVQSSKKNENSGGKKPHIPPFYKADLKSGPMRHAGEVPFVWEQIPGRRKDGEGIQDRSVQRPPVAPKLPPGRNLEVQSRSLNKKVEEKTISRPQNDDGVGSRRTVLPVNGNVSNALSVRQKVLPTNGSVAKPESVREREKDKKDTDSEDGDEVYADALDTLSRSESFLFNCSVSGISGLDETNVTRPGASSIDSQSRDYMMDRFLPAAKAMASETTQHASWKQPVAREQPLMMKTVPKRDKRLSPYQSKPYVIPQYVHEVVDEESEDEDDNYSEAGKYSGPACGLIPKFCLKNSFCLLNPVPGMKVRTRAPLSSARNLTPQVKTTYSRAYGETDDGNNWEAVYKHKLISGLQALDDDSKVTSESNQLTYWSDSQTPDGSSPHRHSPGGGISPFRTEAIQSPFQEGVGFLGVPKQVKSVRTNHSISHKDSKRRSASLSPMAEKTLHVDSGHVQTSIQYSSSSNTNSDSFRDCRGTAESPVAESFFEDINKFMIEESSNLQSSPNRSNPDTLPNGMEEFGRGDNHNQRSRFLTSSKVGSSRSPAHDKTEQPKIEDQSSIVCYSQLPLAPPLPKSPSESWLWRTLPSVSSKNGATLHHRKYTPKAPAIDPKWETIVKSSNGHPGHFRFSELSNLCSIKNLYKKPI